ncbi:MAG: FAD/NAD(P)-binding oxidoreductase [Bryobacter sp.]|nr:FAD/NAD(P)-binding oxidoreductase [Bryobacter sp.]
MHYLIVGNGVAGVSAALKLREREQEAKIALLSGESDYFFSRTALMYAYMDQMSLKDLEPYERGKYKDLRIDLIKGWMSDLDAEARLVTLSDGRTIRYDKLLLATGSLARQTDWPGLAQVKEGVVNFVTLQDLGRCEALTPSTREAVVVGGGLIGVELVECLLHHGRKITFLVKDPWYWPVALGGEEGEMINQHIRNHGVDLRLNEQVTEVFAGEGGRIRGVRLASGAEVPCQMLGVAIGVTPQIEFLRRAKTPPALNRGIVVDEAFLTSLPDVYAAGDCAEITLAETKPFVEQIWYSAKRHGMLAAQAMLGDPIHYQKPLFFNSAKFFEIEYTTVGQVNDAPQDAEHFFWKHPHKEASIRLVTRNGALIGANLLGARWDHTVFERWVREHRSRAFVLAHLREAQFDFEFGRLDLRPLYEKELVHG